MAERRDTRHGEVRESVPPLPFVEHAAALIEALGLRRVGREWHGPCPACGCTDRFWIADYGGRLSVNCRQCRGPEPFRALVANGLLPRPGRGPDKRLHDRGSEEPSRSIGLTQTMTGTPSEVITEAHRSRREQPIDDADSSGDAMARRTDGHRVPPDREGSRQTSPRRASRDLATRCVGVACHVAREAMNAACRHACSIIDPDTIARLALLPEAIGRAIA